MNLICIDTNRNIAALPNPDPNNIDEFSKNFNEIARLNRDALERMKKVLAPPEDEARVRDILAKQEIAVQRMEAMAETVSQRQQVTDEERAALRHAIDTAADAFGSYGVTGCDRA